MVSCLFTPVTIWWPTWLLTQNIDKNWNHLDVLHFYLSLMQKSKSNQFAQTIKFYPELQKVLELQVVSLWWIIYRLTMKRVLMKRIHGWHISKNYIQNTFQFDNSKETDFNKGKSKDIPGLTTIVLRIVVFRVNRMEFAGKCKKYILKFRWNKKLSVQSVRTLKN